MFINNSCVKTLKHCVLKHEKLRGYLKAIITRNVCLHENVTSTFLQYIN